MPLDFASQTEPPKIICIKEKPLDSIVRDGFSVVCAFVLILPGWALGSSAMQWAGFIMLGIVAMARAMGLRKKYTMTVDEARKFLDNLHQ